MKIKIEFESGPNGSVKCTCTPPAKVLIKMAEDSKGKVLEPVYEYAFQALAAILSMNKVVKHEQKQKQTGLILPPSVT